MLQGGPVTGRQSLPEQRAVSQQRVHQGAVVAVRVATPSLAVDVQSKADVTLVGDAVGHGTHRRVEAAPVVREEDRRAPPRSTMALGRPTLTERTAPGNGHVVIGDPAWRPARSSTNQ